MVYETLMNIFHIRKDCMILDNRIHLSKSSFLKGILRDNDKGLSA